LAAFLTNHCLREHGFDHFIHVVVRFEVVVASDSVGVDWAGEVLIFAGDPPVKDNVTCPLVTKLQRALGLLLGHPSENEERLLALS